MKIDPDALEKWDKERIGKPINEWPPLPKEIDFIKFDNGIMITSAENLTRFLKESGWKYKGM